MAGPAVPPDPDQPSVLPPGARFEGLLSFRGVARVDGELSGEIFAGGTLWIGESGRVKARVEVDELWLEGELSGEVRVRVRAYLGPQARLRGELTAPRLVISDGSVVQARCQTAVPDEVPPAAASCCTSSS